VEQFGLRFWSLFELIDLGLKVFYLVLHLFFVLLCVETLSVEIIEV
jgi:hypothetical protein